MFTRYLKVRSRCQSMMKSSKKIQLEAGDSSFVSINFILNCVNHNLWGHSSTRWCHWSRTWWPQSVPSSLWISWFSHLTRLSHLFGSHRSIQLIFVFYLRPSLCLYFLNEWIHLHIGTVAQGSKDGVDLFEGEVERKGWLIFHVFNRLILFDLILQFDSMGTGHFACKLSGTHGLL